MKSNKFHFRFVVCKMSARFTIGKVCLKMKFFKSVGIIVTGLKFNPRGEI